MSYIDILGQKAKACKKDIAFASTTQKNDALLEIAHILRVCKDDIIEANKVDPVSYTHLTLPTTSRV